MAQNIELMTKNEDFGLQFSREMALATNSPGGLGLSPTSVGQYNRSFLPG